MKALFTLLFLVLFGSLNAQVPDYLGNNPQWRQDWWFGYSWPCLEIHNYIYYLNGDSIVGNVTYKKVFERGKVEHDWMAPPPSFQCEESWYYNNFRMLIRQDNLRMYIRDFDGIEYLLYDFDLAIGDTLPITYNYPFSEPILVTGIDSILVGNSYRKIFHLASDYWEDHLLLEGVGFESGLLDYFPNYEFPTRLLCFSQNDTTWYPNYGDPCDLTVDIQTLTTEKEIQLYPNPVVNNLMIELPASLIINQVVAYDVLGNEINLRYMQTNPNQVKVYFSGIKNGFYFLKLITSNLSGINLKVVKQ
jgi:hypothetical protein